MGDIIAKAVGMVLIILLAYFMKQRGLFKKEDSGIIGGMLININLPCVIIVGFQTFEYDVSLVIAVFLSIIVSVIGIFISYLISRKMDSQSQILLLMGSTGYNIGIFTVPFVSSFLSSSALVCTLMFDMGNAILVFGTTAAITSAIVNKETSNPIPLIIKRLFSTVPFVTYLLMIVLQVLNINLSSFVYEIAGIASDATAFLAMIMIGIMIEFNINKEDLKQSAAAICTRYAISGITCVIIYMLPLDLEIRKALIIAMCSPMSTSSIVLSQKLGCKQSLLGVFSSLNIIISIFLIIGVIILL